MKILTGILDNGRGKVGPVIGSEWKGQAYLKEYFIPANPQSEKQVFQRAKFLLAKWCASSVLESWCQGILDANYDNMSGFNALMRCIISTQPVYSPGEFLTYIQLQNADRMFSQGNLHAGACTVAEYSTGTGAFEVHWDTGLGTDGLATDKVSIIVHWNSLLNSLKAGEKPTFATFRRCFAFVDVETRTDGVYTGALSAGLDATDLWANVIFHRPLNGKSYLSDSKVLQFSAP